MIVAIHQPQYLPWLGYFDKMLKADVFCYLDTVQYKKKIGRASCRERVSY